MKKSLQAIWRWTKKIFLILFLAQFLYILLLRWINPPITVTQLVSWVQGYGLTRNYVSHKAISPYARLAVIASEDQLFPDHNGFDWKSIKKAMRYNQRKPGRVRGASTISQQVAKNVFLWQGRSKFRKALEAYFTFMIEVFWGKQRIMDVYLNVIEMGEGIFGIEAAAQNYFDKPARNLTRQEAAMIAACLPNPKRYRVKPPSAFVSARAKAIVNQMNNLQVDSDVLEIMDIPKK